MPVFLEDNKGRLFDIYGYNPSRFYCEILLLPKDIAEYAVGQDIVAAHTDKIC